MNVYLTNDGEYIFTGNIRPNDTLICSRIFTTDEMKFPKRSIGGNNIEVDLAKKNAYETARFNALIAQRIKEIDEKTARLITESGYTFKGQLMSSSDIHKAKLESLHNNRDSVEMQAMYPFKFANKDNTGFVEITNAADIHTMYIALNLTLRFSKEMSGNLLKEQLQAKDANGNYLITLAELENFVDNRT